jgi:succinate dehydrogenase/fumarate reductase flavoprotein subunit
MIEQRVIETDVLVVGGGLAGSFAAIKAREQGLDVTLVAKGYVGASGLSPWAHVTAVYNPQWGHDLGEWLEDINSKSEYVNNREWSKTVLMDSFERAKDLESWGVKFVKDEKGNYVGLPGPISKFSSRALIWAPIDADTKSLTVPLRNHPLQLGVHIFERTMIVDLIQQDGKVVGATGFSLDSSDLLIFKAKATVLAAGTGGHKPRGAVPIGDLTADGHVMAYRAGAEISGKEFADHHPRANRNKGGVSIPSFAPLLNADGNKVPNEGRALYSDFEAQAGRVPLKQGEETVVSNGSGGMSLHVANGVWPVDKDCASGVPGLYVAGDNCATFSSGAFYAAIGIATLTASVTGTRAGTAAAKYARQMAKPEIKGEELSKSREFVLTPRERKGGFSPAWVTKLLQNYMVPFYVYRVKRADRLQATLTLVEYLRDQLVPKLRASSPHELRLAHETRNMVTNAEMQLRASLFRTESRGQHYREDYPRRDDPEWLAWVMLKREDGQMKVYKKPIPKEWWPDLSKDYKERYPNIRFPGE